MATEQYSNLASTLVGTGGYSLGSGSLLVGSTGSPFPASPQFRVAIADSSTLAVKVILLVTAITDATHFAVTAEGTDANANAGDLVYGVISAGALDQIRSDVHQYGTYASLPSTTGQKAGNRYKCTDTAFDFIFTGSVWAPYYSGNLVTLPLAPASYSTAGTGVSLTASKGSLILTGTLSSWQVGVVSASSPITIEAGFIHLLGGGSGGNNSVVGICHSDGTKYKFFLYSSAGIIGVQYNTAINTFSTSRFSQNMVFGPPFVFMKIVLDSSHRTYYIGDGADWVQVFQETNTADLTTSKVGVAMFTGNGTTAAVGKFFHFTTY